ncbi:hypothetical protein FZEAL_5091 [Fusarium zealandicum]|uniref:Carboxypeptidase Y inhibitor n=1 Tax=Fusarium zealandicum TaxID=1053134 RepID=A0A8H4UL72_9HYPO|nr:hypothetical protein FZEAL_5091 [Fusarium zealandicum]
MLKSLSILAVAQLVASKLGPDLSHVRQKLEDAEIIPTVIDDFTPALGLGAKWDTQSASLGNTLKPADLQSPPSIYLEKPECKSHRGYKMASDVTHVLVLTDPDAPSRDDPQFSEFCHWIAAGVPTSSSSVDPIHGLQDVIEYVPPGPPPKTGKHRYVFLVFVPANGTTEKLHLTKPQERRRWGSEQAGYGAREWSHQHGLVPIAANFFYAQNEEQ